MEELLDLIKAADDFYSMNGADLSSVKQAENELGLIFADDYKEYVLAFGVATFDGHELTGVCNSDRLSVVATTKRARDFFPQFPEELYVVEEMQFDHILTVQDSTGAVFNYGPADEAKRIAGSLQEYLFPDSCKAESEEVVAEDNEVSEE